MENANVWEFVVKSVEDVRRRGLDGLYAILCWGKDMDTGKAKSDYIKEGYTVLPKNEFEKLIDENEKGE